MNWSYRSIARTAGITRDQLNEYVKTLQGGALLLSEEREFKLARQILKFSDVLISTIERYVEYISKPLSDF